MIAQEIGSNLQILDIKDWKNETKNIKNRRNKRKRKRNYKKKSKKKKIKKKIKRIRNWKMERLYIMTMRQLKIMNNKEIYKLNLII